MDYAVKDLDGSLLIVSNRGFELWARSPYVGLVNFDIYCGELKYNEKFLQRAFEEIEELAGRLGVGAVQRYSSSKQLHISIDLSVGGLDGQQMLQELAKLFDSVEFAEAVVC